MIAKVTPHSVRCGEVGAGEGGVLEENVPEKLRVRTMEGSSGFLNMQLCLFGASKPPPLSQSSKVLWSGRCTGRIVGGLSDGGRNMFMRSLGGCGKASFSGVLWEVLGDISTKHVMGRNMALSQDARTHGDRQNNGLRVLRSKAVD